MTKITVPGVNRPLVKRKFPVLKAKMTPPQYTVSPIERGGQNLGPQPPKAISRRLGRLGRAGGIAAKLQAAMAKAAGRPLPSHENAQESKRGLNIMAHADKVMARGGRRPMADRILVGLLGKGG